ncbi:hypothetical protein DOK80_000384 [Enterococcus sp. DIV0849a]
MRVNEKSYIVRIDLYYYPIFSFTNVMHYKSSFLFSKKRRLPNHLLNELLVQQ